MFDFEYGYPSSSCYTEQDLRYLASKSKSLTFNMDRFIENSGWMGIREGSEFPGKGNMSHLLDAIEDKYYVKNISDYGNYEGTAMYAQNRNPFFYRWENQVCFTIRAIFAGRENIKTTSSLRESCDAKCYICGSKIDDSEYKNRLSGGVVLDFYSDRFEVICKDCYIKFDLYSMDIDTQYNKLSDNDKKCLDDSYEHRRWYGLHLSVKEQILFTRFALSNIYKKVA